MKRLLLITFLFMFILSFGQKVGVNTENPQGIFHVDGAGNNNTTGVPTALQQTDDVIVNSSGNVGIGTISPTNKLHVTATADPVKLEGVELDDAATSSNSYSLIIGNDGTVKKQTMLTNSDVPGIYAKLVATAGFDDESTVYYTADYGANIRGLIFTGRRYDPGNTYNNTTGIFTAPETGYYKFDAVLLLYNSTGADLRASTARLGVSKPGQTTFASGNASFSSLNQIYPATNSSSIPIVIPFSGMQKLQKGEQVTLGIRYITPASMTLQVSAMSYDIKTSSYMSISYMGN